MRSVQGRWYASALGIVMTSLLLLCAAAVYGQDATEITVSCDPASVYVNQETICTVSVTNTDGSAPPTGTITLTATPSASGDFLPAFPLDLSGGTVQSNSVSINVIYTPSAAQSPGLPDTHEIAGSYKIGRAHV